MQPETVAAMTGSATGIAAASLTVSAGRTTAGSLTTSPSLKMNVTMRMATVGPLAIAIP